MKNEPLASCPVCHARPCYFRDERGRAIYRCARDSRHCRGSGTTRAEARIAWGEHADALACRLKLEQMELFPRAAK